MLYNQGMVECLAEKSVRTRRDLHPSIIAFICQEEENEKFVLFENQIYLFSQNTRGMEQLIVHIPITILLVSKGYDWAMVKFESVCGDKKFPVNAQGGYYDKDLYPCKVLCFLKAKDDSIHAVVHCCVASNHNNEFSLVERWNKEYGIDEVSKVLVP